VVLGESTLTLVILDWKKLTGDDWSPAVYFRDTFALLLDHGIDYRVDDLLSPSSFQQYQCDHDGREEVYLFVLQYNYLG